MKYCIKCGSTSVAGPRYEVIGRQERLKYVCGCGYTWSTPTRDANEQANPFGRTLPMVNGNG